MIERIELSNWKRHVRCDVRLRPGLNFILGPNGSGKSSLLQAISFALSGLTPSPVAKDAVHMGSTTGASVTLTLKGTRITRSIDSRGRINEVLSTTQTDTRSSSEFLLNTFGADVRELTHLLFVSEGDIYKPGAGDVGIDRQLEQLLPLRPLQSLARMAGGRRASLARLLKGRRNELRLSKDEEARLALRRSELEAGLAEVETTEPALLGRERDLLELVRRRDDARRMSLQVNSWKKDLDELLGSVDLEGQEPLEAGDVMQRRAALADQRVRELIAQLGQLKGERMSVDNAGAMLEGVSDGFCPLCAQPLTEAHRRRLLNEQLFRRAQLDAEILTLGEALDEAERDLQDVTTSLSKLRLAIAAEPLPGEAYNDFPEDLDEALNQVRDELSNLRGQRGRIFEELASARERLASAEADRRVEEEIVNAFKKDALLQATEEAVSSFISEMRAGVMVPLRQELERQSKRFRPSAPWRLIVDDDGRIAIEMQGETRPYEALSAGERTVVIVLLRVALAVALTSARFVVLDEPLEHLDPPTRRVLIASLHNAVKQNVVDQIIVSTYEEALVRRLQQGSLAHAVYLNG